MRGCRRNAGSEYLLQQARVGAGCATLAKRYTHRTVSITSKTDSPNDNGLSLAGLLLHQVVFGSNPLPCIVDGKTLISFRKNAKGLKILGIATVETVTIMNPAVRLTLCTWIGRDTVTFILRLLAGARCFVLKRIVTLIRLHCSRVRIVEMAILPAAIVLGRQGR